MKYAKLLLAIVLIIILVLALVACGEKDPCESGHTAGQWIIDVDATCTADGIKHQVCSVCGDIINIEIITAPMTEHDFKGSDSCVKCGISITDVAVRTYDMSATPTDNVTGYVVPRLVGSGVDVYIKGSGAMKDYAVYDKPFEEDNYSVFGAHIESGVTSIGDYVFAYQNHLSSVTYGENSQLAFIGVSAFAGCTSLENIAIPDGIVTIYLNAFDGCDGLKTVYYDGTFEQWENITFANSTANPMEYALKLYAEGKLVTSAVTQGVDTVNHTITVGNTAATSGAFAAVGVPFNYAQEAYFWYFENYTEGYKDAIGNSYTIDFKHYDDGFVAATGVTYTEKLVEEDKVFALVGHFGADTVSATTDYIEEAGIPMVYGVCGVSDLYNAERNVMAVQPIYDTEGQSMVATAFAPVSAGGLAATKLGVISTTDDAGVGMLNGIQIEVAKLGKGSAVVYQTVSANSTNYETQVNALKTAGCDVVIIAANQAPFINIANAFVSANYDNVKILTSYMSANTAIMGGLVQTGVISTTREVYAGAWLVTGSMPAETKGWNDFVEYVRVMTLYAKHNGETLITTADSTYGPYVALYFGEYDWAADGVSAYFLNSYTMAGYVSANVFCQGLTRMSGKALLWEDFIKAMESAPINVPMGLNVNYADGQRIGVDAFALNKYTVANNGVGEVYREITSLADLEDAVVG